MWPIEELVVGISYEKEEEISSIDEDLYNFLRTDQILEINDISYKYHGEHTKLVDGNRIIIVFVRPVDNLKQVSLTITEMKNLNQKIRTYYEKKERYACNEASSKARDETLEELEEKLTKEKTNKKEKSRIAIKLDLLHVFLTILLVIMTVINIIR